MTCASCGGASSIRFCSYPCLVAFSKRQRGVECALCQWDPLLSRPGNENTQDICPGCAAAPENKEWGVPSVLERGTDDVDTTVQVSGGARLESVFGGARKMDTRTAHRVLMWAGCCVLRRRRRRNENGHPLRGWEWVAEEMPLSEVAELSECTKGYVHKVLSQVMG